ncbi:hypothetical protein V5O48_016236 [Marasmius crinis-equi]|uniref:MYND-type domain-containing protein n=1 Tax=Marasmius crinis-equi TaxID=585013 RepID=A0ABR3ESA1_9AGAR
MSFSALANDFRPKPPSSINPDRLNQREEKTFATLMVVADALRNGAFGVSTYHFVNDNWSKIWPWVISSCRGVLDRPPPTTVAGVGIVYQIVEIAPVFFNYPMHQPDNDDFRAVLKPLLVSTPRVLALALEMWLYGTTIEHPIREGLTNAVGLLLEVHADVNGLVVRLPPGEVTKAFSKVIDDTERWDIPGVCMRGIIYDLSQPLINCYTLRSHVIILSVLARGISPNSHMPKLLQKDAIRWATTVISKLSSSNNYWTGKGYELDDVTVCFREAIRFLLCCFINDTYHALAALDEGLLLSIFKARELIIEDARRRGHDSGASLALNIRILLERITVSLVHRPILVRAVRNLKKIERLEEQLGVTDPFEAECGSLHESWLQLETETWRRHAIKNSQEPYISQKLQIRICGFHQAHDRTYELGLDHVYMRCSGCHVDVYCSEKCRRFAWLLSGPHRKPCEFRRQTQQSSCFIYLIVRGRCADTSAEGEARELGNLEFAEIQKQMAFDVAEHAEDIRRLKDKYFLEHISQQSDKTREHVLIWMDYTEFPIAIEAITASEGYKRVLAIGGAETGSADFALEGAVAVAKIPWRNGSNRSVLMIQRFEKASESGTTDRRRRKDRMTLLGKRLSTNPGERLGCKSEPGQDPVSSEPAATQSKSLNDID